MFESLGFESLTPAGASVILGLALGVAFGILAQRTRFCFRRSMVAPAGERGRALGVWLTALAVALLGVQGAVYAGLIDFAGHRFFVTDMPVVAIVLGGLMFGVGMVLTRGCISRLSVLAGSGNLRAALVILVFAVVAHATIKGLLAPLRVALGSLTVPVGDLTGFAALPGGALLWTLLIAAALLAYGLRSDNRPSILVMAALIGILVPLGWVGTGFLLLDDFDPIAMESLSFTSSSADSLFFVIASTSISAGFGTGVLAGVLAGGLIASLVAGEFAWQTFETPGQTGRYVAGAALMGIGGVLAGGCTVGAGLSGVPTLSFAALLAIVSIGVGAKAAAAALGRLTPSVGESAGASTTPAALPAE
ncbi:YeeE/YedE family protein [Brevirhabdus sp.]|uniref:YeeE/YedE family protein n=1 Tax=Brevirhabdus sp. TaxID=2004514 RepID=UPI00405843FD